MKKILAAILLFILSCSNDIVIKPIIPPDTDYCKIGCQRLQSLIGRDGNPGCEESRVIELPQGEIVTCENFCIETQNNGRSLCPSSWINLTSCDQIEKARLSCTVQ